MIPVLIPGAIREAAKHWINWGKTEGHSPRTIESKESTLLRFIQYSEDNDWPLLSEITNAHIVQYFAWLSKQTRWDGLRDAANSKLISASTVNSHFRRIRAFFEWASQEDQDYISRNPFGRMKAPKFLAKVIPEITPEQIHNLRALTDYKNPKLARTPLQKFRILRDRAALEFCIDSCTRLSEVNGIQVQDVHVGAFVTVTVTGKGQKQREVPLKAKSSQVLIEYMEARAEFARPGVTHLWVSAHDTKGEPMNKGWLQKVVNKLGERIGMDRLHHHMFRHRFAVEWLADDHPERHLMQLGGWSKSIPSGYLNNVKQAQAAAIHRARPDDGDDSEYRPSRIA